MAVRVASVGEQSLIATAESSPFDKSSAGGDS